MIEKSSLLDDGLKLRRYLSFSKFLDLLEHQRLFFCALSAFPDKLEGRLTVLDDFMLSGSADLLGNIVNNVMPTVGADAAQREASKKRAQQFDEEFAKRTISTVFGEILTTKEVMASLIFSKQKDWLDATCWDKNPTESIAMWKVYGSAESSICIHTTVSALTKSLSLPDDLAMHVGPIEYIDHREDVYTGGHLLGYFMRKNAAYSYENEVRALVYNPKADPMGERIEVGSYLPIDCRTLINAVTVSPEAPVWFVDLVTDLVNKRYELQVPVSISELDQLR